MCMTSTPWPNFSLSQLIVSGLVIVSCLWRVNQGYNSACAWSLISPAPPPILLALSLEHCSWLVDPYVQHCFYTLGGQQLYSSKLEGCLFSFILSPFPTFFFTSFSDPTYVFPVA